MANLLLDEDGHVVLVDFGIAETAGGDPAHPARRTGHVVGSPAFMAPELVLGEAPQPAADLWSLGTTLYTAVEGRPPCPQAETVPTLTAVLHDAPQPARHAGRLQPLLALLLDKDPVRRPSHDAVHTMLTEAYPSNRPIPASTIGGGTAGTRQQARRLLAYRQRDVHFKAVDRHHSRGGTQPTTGDRYSEIRVREVTRPD